MAVKILVVDDSATVRMLQKHTLRSEGFEIEEAGSGVEAIKRITASPPDIVLMDIVMPDMDGVQTCRAIKARPDTHGIGVIMVTSKGEENMIKRAFEAGCDDYVTKPIRKTELIAKIRKLLER